MNYVKFLVLFTLTVVNVEAENVKEAHLIAENVKAANAIAANIIAENIKAAATIVANVINQPAPEVTIEQGVLSGKISEDGTIHEYLGIPYAKTNSETRFQAPLPPPNWNGTYKAVDQHYSCLQSSIIGSVSGIEDCLKVNVYVPVKAQKPIPVMVFIHGGAYVFGDGGKLIYGPEFLVKQDVILVTFNYRLGALGFLCLGIKEAPGNAGLKDQLAALRWVKRNIGSFGGDTESITLFGESAGATSTSIMIASNASDGLFNRAIAQSGASISSRAINRDPVRSAYLLARNMGYSGQEDPQNLYKFFSKAPLKELVTTKIKLPWSKFLDTSLIHRPCVEKSFPGIEAVVSDVPYNLMRAAGRKNIPVIHGSNSKEGLYLIGDETNETLWSRNAGYMFGSDLEFPSEEEEKQVSKVVNRFYFADDPISIEKINNITDIFTHLYFEVPELLETDIFLENSNAKVYNYIFKYSGWRNVIKFMTGNKNVEGASHGDDLFYIFKARSWPFQPTREDQQIIDWITKLWTNFAKYGNPTPEASTDLPVTWVPSSKRDLKVLRIDKELSMGPVFHRESYDLWKNIYSKYRKLTWGY